MKLTDESAARLATSDPQRECRSPHLPRAGQSLRRRARGARRALPELARRGGAQAARPHLLGRRCRARDRDGAADQGAVFVAPGEPGYPARLRMIDDAPPLISVRGTSTMLEAADRSPSSVRATRPPRERSSRARSRATLGDAGFVIASGLARGIDAAAHRATLASGTVAVLAGGQDRIYPPEHAGLLGQHRWSAAPRFPRCRSAGSRARAISPAATA